MRVAVLFSGGKDSNLALYKAVQRGWKVKYLVSIISKNPESYMFHYPNIELTQIQAKAMLIPIIKKETLGEKERELEDLKEVLSSIKNEIDGIVSGAIESNYQKQRIDKIAEELGLKSLVPLWHEDPEKLWNEILNLGFEVIITGVFAEGFNKSWLGKKVDFKVLEELKKLNKKYKIHLFGEGGEFETFVLNGPLFKKKIKIIEDETIWKKDSGFYLIKKVKLVRKS